MWLKIQIFQKKHTYYTEYLLYVHVYVYTHIVLPSVHFLMVYTNDLITYLLLYTLVFSHNGIFTFSNEYQWSISTAPPNAVGNRRLISLFIPLTVKKWSQLKSSKVITCLSFLKEYLVYIIIVILITTIMLTSAIFSR